MKTFKPLLLAAVLATSASLAIAASPATPASPDLVTSQFLHALNSGTGPAINTLTPAQARQVLVGAQNSVKVDLSGIDVNGAGGERGHSAFSWPLDSGPVDSSPMESRYHW